jgi:hypothetical protein
MDPYLHTFIAMVLLYAFYKVGQISGTQRGIESTLAYLLNNDVCTEEDLRKAHENFDKKN